MFDVGRADIGRSKIDIESWTSGVAFDVGRWTLDVGRWILGVARCTLDVGTLEDV